MPVRRWNETVREPVRPFGVVGQTAAGSIVGAAIGRQFGSGNDRDTLTVLGAVAGGAVAHRRAVVNAGYAARDVVVQRCEVVNDRLIVFEFANGVTMHLEDSSDQYECMQISLEGDQSPWII